MYLSFSKTIAKFGGFRLRIGGRLTKKNSVYMWLVILFASIFKMLWYLMIAVAWLFYAMGYGIYWCIKKIVSACKKNGNTPVSTPSTHTDTSVSVCDDSMTEEDRCVSDITPTPQPNGKPPKSKADIARWIVGGFFALGLTVTGFHYSSIFIIASAFLMFPFSFVKNFLAKKNIKTALVIISSVVLFAVGAVTSPSTEDTPSISDDGDNSESNGESDKNPNDANGNNQQNSPTNGGASSDNNNGDNNDAENTPIEEEPNTENSDENSPSDENADDSNESTEVLPDNGEQGVRSYIVTYSQQVISNDGVGEDWSFGLKYNGEILNSSRIEASSSNALKLTAYAIESDASADDYGYSEISFSNIAIGVSETITTTVTVREGGKTARIEFTIKIQRVE